MVFPIDHSVNYIHQVVSDKEGEELEDQFEAYTLNVENQIKEHSDFSTQDTNRNGTFSLTQTGVGEGYVKYYDCEINFTIENAVITILRQTQTDLTGTAKDDFLESYANTEEINYLAEHPTWVSL